MAILAVAYLLLAGWGAGRLLRVFYRGTQIRIGVGCTLTSFSLGRVFRGVRGGLFGGVLAGTLHSISGAIFFSGSSATDFVPVNFSERIVWGLTCGICICIGLLLSLTNRFGQTITDGASTGQPSEPSSFVGTKG